MIEQADRLFELHRRLEQVIRNHPGRVERGLAWEDEMRREWRTTVAGLLLRWEEEAVSLPLGLLE